MGWWLEILEAQWNRLRDAVKKYGVLPVVILAVYFVGMIVLLTLVRSELRFMIRHG